MTSPRTELIPPPFITTAMTGSTVQQMGNIMNFAMGIARPSIHSDSYYNCLSASVAASTFSICFGYYRVAFFNCPPPHTF